MEPVVCTERDEKWSLSTETAVVPELFVSNRIEFFSAPICVLYMHIWVSGTDENPVI